jgi:hypothetical protein
MRLLLCIEDIFEKYADEEAELFVKEQEENKLKYKDQEDSQKFNRGGANRTEKDENDYNNNKRHERGGDYHNNKRSGPKRYNDSNNFEDTKENQLKIAEQAGIHGFDSGAKPQFFNSKKKTTDEE